MKRKQEEMRLDLTMHHAFSGHTPITVRLPTSPHLIKSQLFFQCFHSEGSVFNDKPLGDILKIDSNKTYGLWLVRDSLACSHFNLL